MSRFVDEAFKLLRINIEVVTWTQVHLGQRSAHVRTYF